MSVSVDHGSQQRLEPERWFLIFETRCDHWLMRWLSPGRFKHVAAVGYVAEANVWLCYTYEFSRARVLAIKPGPTFERWFAAAVDQCGVLRMTAPRERTWAPWFTGSCVTPIRHLLGIRSGALLPDQFWRHCIANGAEVICDGYVHAEDAGAAGERSAEGSAARG